MSYRLAQEKYGIHRNTLLTKVKEVHTGKVGGRRGLTDEEENIIAAHTIAVAAFGFPITMMELRLNVKSYLHKAGKRNALFKNNLPGKVWAHLFLKRHKTLSQRFAKNITLARANNDKEILGSFFDHYEKEVEGVVLENLWNYDETNLVDDPGMKKNYYKTWN
ncbi:uncharacterized protein LOC120349667 [Nilaparvata lugens]|uniref:uncharacterized protein LOC120349667 n=1 Tax=Nilaparvata lugens TaxID=108931 RepID=UPI00193E5419|nr:uncharacterized protein LOC120349667 [Nilaparvata lugens]